MPPRATKPLSSTTFLVLLALADRSRYGLDIIDEVDRRTEGRVRLGPGSLYNAIKRMLVAGLIAEDTEGGSSDPRRRYYRITEEGLELVAREAAGLERLVLAARDKNLLAPESNR